MLSLSDSEITAALRECLGEVELLALEDVSPGLSGSQVLKTKCKTPLGQVESWYLKRANTSICSPLGLDGESSSLRERAAYRLARPHLIPGVELPAAHLTDDGQWICMEDRSDAIERQYDPGLAEITMDRLAAIAAFSATLPGGWEDRFPFVRRGWMTYAGFIDEALENLAYIEEFGMPLTSLKFGFSDIEVLRRFLQTAEDLSARASALPATVLHGDLNPSNCGISDSGNLVLIDLEHIGVGPLGSDAATFTMLYNRFGGTGSWTVEHAVQSHHAALGKRGVAVERDQVALAFAIWQGTWGLHLRLGPGTSYLLREPENASKSEVEDIIEGLRVAVRLSRWVF